MVKKRRKIVLCDTNIFVGYFRGDAKVVAELDLFDFEDLYLSSITVGEIFFGMKQSERRKTQRMIKEFNIIHVDGVISELFTQLMSNYPSKRLSVADAMIAATALAHRCILFTINRSDFDFIPGITLYNPTQQLP